MNKVADFVSSADLKVDASFRFEIFSNLKGSIAL